MKEIRTNYRPAIVMLAMGVALVVSADKREYIECYPPRIDIVKQYEYLDRYIECNERSGAECWSAQINSGQVGYEELIGLQDMERAKYDEYRNDLSNK